MTTQQVISHDEARRVLRRAGFDAEKIDELLAKLADPIDLIRDRELLARYGVERSHLVDMLGGSP